MSNKVIFLDHDGVMCLETEWGSRFKNRATFDKFNRGSVAVLNEIINITNVDIVVSSDWRIYCSLEEMQQFYFGQGIIKGPIGFTKIARRGEIDDFLDRELIKSHSWEREREAEIQEWIMRNEIDSWVAVDDLELNQLSNFVHTPDPKLGIQMNGVKEQIINLLM